MANTSLVVSTNPTITPYAVWMWQEDNSLCYLLASLIIQAILIAIVTGSLAFLLKPFRQPKFVANVVGGIILGPSVFGKIPNYMDVLYPTSTTSLETIETLARMGLLSFMFTVGIKVDLEVVTRTGRRAWAIAGVALVIPLAVMLCMNTVNQRFGNMNNTAGFVIFLGASVACTAFYVLDGILNNLKLLTTDIGKIAMSSAIISDSCAWVLLILSISVTNHTGNIGGSFRVIASGVVFVVVVFFGVRLALPWVVRRALPWVVGRPVREAHIKTIMMSVILSMLVAEALGIHAVFGVFIFGLSIPTGPFGESVIEKLDLVSESILLPLFFTVNGLRCQTAALKHPGLMWFLILTVLVTAAAKVACTLLVSVYYGMPMREGLSLGILMNTKGLVEIIILHIGLDNQVIDIETFTVLMLISLAMSAMVTPLASAAVKYRDGAPDARPIDRGPPSSSTPYTSSSTRTGNSPISSSTIQIGGRATKARRTSTGSMLNPSR